MTKHRYSDPDILALVMLGAIQAFLWLVIIGAVLGWWYV